jgi:hypothetical protein
VARGDDGQTPRGERGEQGGGPPRSPRGVREWKVGFPTLKNLGVMGWVGETTVRLPWGKRRDGGGGPTGPQGRQRKK